MKEITPSNKTIKVFAYVLCLLFAVVVMISTYKSSVLPASKIGTSYVNNQFSTPIGEILKETRIQQTFIANCDNFSGISLLLATYGRENKDNLNISLVNCKNNSVIQSWIIDASTLKDNTFSDLLLDKPIEKSSGQKYAIAITSKNGTPGNATTVWLSSNIAAGNELYVNNVLLNNELCFKIFTANAYISSVYILFCLAILAFLVISGLFLIYRDIKIELVFLFTVIFWGIIYMLVLPPVSAPDEPAHINTAYKYSNILMFKQSSDANGHVLVREEDNKNTLNILPSLSDYRYIYQNFLSASKANNQVPKNEAVVQLSSPTVYIPQTLGITVARVLNMGYIPLLFTGRLFNLIFYAIVLFFAIKIIPIGKMILFSITMIPITLEQISSFSYDSALISLSIFFVAYCLFLIYTKSKIVIRDVIILTLVAVCFAPCKMTYLPLILLCLLIPKEKFKNKSIHKLYVASIVLFPIIVTAIYSLIAFKYQQNAASDHGLYTLSSLVSDPLHTIQLFIRTLISKSDFYVISMLGGYLGWLEIRIPYVLVFGMLIILFLSSLSNSSEKIYQPNSHKIVSALIIGCIFFAILLSLLLVYTPKTLDTIDGVQGRYFLPILPLALLLIRNKNLELKKSIDKYLIYSANMLNVFVCFSVVKTIISR